MIPLKTLSPFRAHVVRWQACTACESCRNRRNVVLCRGTVPCDILFCGEAPGPSEDVLGQPFVGPAGHLLNDIIYRADLGNQQLRLAFTNLVACIPLDEEGKKFGEPSEESIKACKPRLEEFIALANPQLIVTVGRLARDFLTPGYRYSVKLPEGVKQAHIVHPAAILRANVAQQSLMRQRCIVTVANAVREVFNGNPE